MQFNNLAKLSNEVKPEIHAEEIDHSEYVMTCINTIPSTSNILENFLWHKSSHSSYNQTECNDKREIINNTFITYVESLLNYTNHHALIQEWKLNIDAVAHEKKIDANVYKPSTEK